MISDYLSNNREHLLLLIAPLKERRKKVLESHSFFDEIIESQFRREVIRILSDDITKSLAISYEDVIIELESISLEDYLK